MHVEATRPVVLPYVPAGQGVQAAEVAPPVEYEPTGQGPVQLALVDPPVPYTPAGHCAVQVDTVSPATEP